MLPIHLSAVDFQEVTLTIATAPDFDPGAQAILGGHASPILPLKPYLAIVSNHDPRTVVAYTVAWTVTLRNQSSEVSHTQFKFPDSVAGVSNGLTQQQGREIRSGEQRLVGMGFEVWPVEYVNSYCDYGHQIAARLGEVKALHIALDAVIFDDGTLLGPDESHLAEHFIAFVQAKQALYHDTVAGLEQGSLREDVFGLMRETAAAPFRPNPLEPMAIYATQSAVEVLAWHDRVLLDAFRRALRREPFTIKRLK